MIKKRLIKRFINRLLHFLARFFPGSRTLRPFLHRLRGVKINGTVFIGEEVYMENEYPENIEINDQCSINVRATILTHFRLGHGKVVLEKKVRVGPHSLISSNSGKTLRIGEGSVVAAGSVVTRSIPKHTMVSGVPAKPIAKVTVPLTLTSSYEDFFKGLRPIMQSGAETNSDIVKG